MPKLPILQGKELVRFCESLGFKITRQRGSHVRMRADDGRSTSIPIHSNKDLPKGLLRKIIREDLELSLDKFADLYAEFK